MGFANSGLSSVRIGLDAVQHIQEYKFLCNFYMLILGQKAEKILVLEKNRTWG
jgi:hypothetical protein